uniref:Uncharacterized protein n=1 Tax=Branchiostoma floridae TaxID=7739 RepID=C3XXN3_BRAFL|eukprot:XP_002611483.1 hypothetical protein BRAFLDRAFT_63882 [Branchiostoma floridae]
MLRVCEKLCKTDGKGRRYGLAHAETGYLRALVDAMADMDRLLQVELLKSLGDVNLEKGRLQKDAGKFTRAFTLYKAAAVRCDNRDQEQGIEHRCEYTERLLKGVLSKGSQGMEQPTEDKETNTVAKVAGKFQILDKKRAAGRNTDSVLVEYAQLMVEGIVNRNNMLETEAIKSLGDMYLKRGTQTRDTRDLTRATALYNTALTGCNINNMQGTVVIVHRLLYTAKIRQDITTTNMKKSTRTQRRQDVRGRKQKYHFSPFSAAPSSDSTKQGMRRQHKRNKMYEEHLQEGCNSMQSGELDKAEQSFAAALKSVHVKGQHGKEADPLYKLGNVYLKRGIQSKDGSDFTKAAALCNAALVRSKREDIEEAIKEITQVFVKDVLKIEQKVDSDDTDKHKLMLKADRKYVEKEISRIEQEVDPYSLDDEDLRIKEVEMKRAAAIKALFQTLVDQRKTFIAGLVDECIDIMGTPPCKYAMIGLGSQATGLVTPYSDLEFVILVEEENERNVSYFRNLTHYLHLKVINLGETILPAMAIKSLNDFYSDDPLNSWFYDSVTPRGFAFDGAMPHACKTPLGRGRNSTGTSELIRTPSNMINILTDDLMFHLKKGYHLASVLANVSFITGEQDLVNEYRSLLTQHLEESNGRALLVMAITDLCENPAMFETQTLTARLLNVKKEIYRFSSLAVSCFALFNSIQTTTIWETIQELKTIGVINCDNAHHLMVMVSISAELRLRTYMNNRGQVENMSALSSLSTDADIGEKLKKVFYISNTKQLMRYYCTERPLEEPPVFFDNSSILKAEVYESLCDFQEFIKFTEQTLQQVQNNMSSVNAARSQGVSFLFKKLGSTWSNLGDHRKAISYHEQSIQMNRSIYGEDTAHPDLASSLNNLGEAWSNLDDHRKAENYYEQSLQMRQSIYGENTPHPDTASSLSNLGNAWIKRGDHRKAVSFYEQSLQMRQSIYGEDTPHPDVAHSLYNLGTAWSKLEDHRKAENYFEQSLQMRRTIYGTDTAHPDIAASLNNLGNVWSDLGDHKKAYNCHEQTLQMLRSIYGEDNAHPDIASSLNNLGTAWSKLEDHGKAVSYYEQSLHMRWYVSGKETAHPDIATSLYHLGSAWGNLKDYRKAENYYEQSIQMRRSIYGMDTAHPDIAASLHNLGTAWSNLGDHRKAVSYYEQSLHMRWRISGKETAHPDIATSLYHLGSAWGNLKDYRKAENYYEQSIQMRRSIYGMDTAHFDIATSLDSLGNVWSSLGDHRKAVSYHEQTLHMRWRIYGKDTAHFDIATSLYNLGEAWRNLGDNRKAISYHEQTLQMWWRIYGEDNVRPDIATSLYNLGEACSNLGDHRKAVSYHEQSLQMWQHIYGQDTAHVVIIALLDKLGAAWSILGDHRKAVSYYEQSLRMTRSIYGKDTAHPDIADSLNNLAGAWRNLGDQRKAVSYYEQLLQMARCIYGKDTAHPNIANVLNNLGYVWSNLGDHRKAVSYNEQTLQMWRYIYGEDTTHPCIVASLDNLGTSWGNLGDHRKAINYHEQSLQMRRRIHGEVTVHPNIAASLDNLGAAWSNLGDHRQAVSYYEQALQMKRSIYGEDTPHPDIVLTLKNLWIACRELGDAEKANVYFFDLGKQMAEIVRTSDG